jgi:hypothetical protein
METVFIISFQAGKPDPAPDAEALSQDDEDAQHALDLLSPLKGLLNIRLLPDTVSHGRGGRVGEGSLRGDDADRVRLSEAQGRAHRA